MKKVLLSGAAILAGFALFAAPALAEGGNVPSTAPVEQPEPFNGATAGEPEVNHKPTIKVDKDGNVSMNGDGETGEALIQEENPVLANKDAVNEDMGQKVDSGMKKGMNKDKDRNKDMGQKPMEKVLPKTSAVK